MKAVPAAVACLLLCVAPPVLAHRLDEFLQATTLAVEKDRVTMRMCLTPGIEVFHTVLADLDTDGDGFVSPEEQRAYAERVLRALSLTVDGNHLPLRLVSLTFPKVEAMQGGLGDILLGLEADVPLGGSSDRRLIFENHYQNGRSVYLVNCLFPKDPDIRVTAQSRNYEQSFYQLDYTQSGTNPPASAAIPLSKFGGWLLAGTLLVPASLAFRWRQGKLASSQNHSLTG